MTDKPKRVSGRKTSPRNKGKPRPATSEWLKERWRNPDKYPEFHEKMRVRDENRERMRREHPEKFFRRGVPDGMRKRDAEPLWARARELADRFIQIMKDKGELPELDDNDPLLMDVIRESVVVPESDAGKAEEALKEAFVLAVGPSNMKIKIQAINTVLNFTKAKPEQKSKLTLDKAEDFLAAIVSDNTSDGD